MSHMDPMNDEIQDLRDAIAMRRAGGEVFAQYTARLAFEECVSNPMNMTARNKLTAALDFLARCI